MSKVAIIDSDCLVYIVGFASERPVHYFKDKSGKSFRAKPGMSKKGVIQSKGEVEFIKKEVDADEQSLARHKMRLVVKRILDRCETADYRMYLTASNDDTQFRKHLAKTLVYKDNRKNMVRPVHYSYLRELLVDEYGAKIVNYYEADDVVAMEHTKHGTDSILCTIDKDLKQVPGLYYDIRQDHFTNVSQMVGDLQLCKQWIMGDMVDNIPGIPGYGEKRTLQFLTKGIRYPRSKIWEEADKKLIAENGLNLQTWVILVEQLYMGYGEDYKERMMEIGNLVFMIRKRGQPLKQWLKEERGIVL